VAQLYLQIWGGLGARINTLLTALYGLEANNLPHELCVHWPTDMTDIHEPEGHTSLRERLFAIDLDDLYDIACPIRYVSTEEFAEAASRHTLYPLEYTQAPSRDPLFRGQIHFNTQPHDESFCVQGHQWMNIDGLHHRVLKRLAAVYDRNLKLKPSMCKLRDGILAQFKGRKVFGFYIRGATVHPAVGPWAAYDRMFPVIREQATMDRKALFFVCCDDHSYLRSIRQEIARIDGDPDGRRLITVPKPNKFNDPEEMRHVTVDIEVMRQVDEFYPTWNSGLGILIASLRGEDFDRYGNTTRLGGAVFMKNQASLCHHDVSPMRDGGWFLT
jgi:hypothetical protein